MPPTSRPRQWAGWTLTLVLALGANRASAQSASGVIAGTVVDRASRAPMSDVRVSSRAPRSRRRPTRGRVPDHERPAGRRAGRRAAHRLHARPPTPCASPAGGTATLNFTLTASLTTLSEVVVTGTVGNQERRAQAAQVATVSAADVKANAAITNVNEMLQSRVPGVSVAANAGSAGTARNIRIRGASSLSLSNQPLVFVDGIRLSEGFGGPLSGGGGQSTDRLNDLNPDDIESIEVVKGPAAATLYGADASVGVIQIITKRGRAGSPSFQQTVRTELGTVDANFTTPTNYANCTAALVAATSTNPLCRGQAVGTLVSDNPLEREGGFQKGSDVLLGWSGRGGGQGYGYFVSLGSDRNIGTLPNNEFQRYSRAARTSTSSRRRRSPSTQACS